MASDYDFKTIEPKWQEFWRTNSVFRATEDTTRPKRYILEMFPYPSGAGLSVGHIKNYGPADVYCRFRHMRGDNVLHPMGWDAFGQPAENEALKRRRNPREMVPEYAANYRSTLERVGCAYDWDREIDSSTPEYYRWTQYIFLLLYQRGLAYQKLAPINWCPSCKTGLANEEVKEGRCWRCDSVVEKRMMQQWYFRITDYAERLLADLDPLDWPTGIKQQQREWIGKSAGATVDFRVADSDASIKVYTTRPDTLWGATFMVLAPEHALVGQITSPDCATAVTQYVRTAGTYTDADRTNLARTKTGVFTGAYATNPVNGEQIPIWVADYVLVGYGTGAIMAVPAHDQRDFEFATLYNLPIRLVYVKEPGRREPALTEARPSGGVMDIFTSPEADVPFPFTGHANSPSTVTAVILWLEQCNLAQSTTQYKMRDWLISRQRYWGAPIPIVHCPTCGPVAVPANELPVMLPDTAEYASSGTGESPLATMPEFVNVPCPSCGEPARRETDTMGGFACSSWYFLRFADPHNSSEFAARDKLDYWLPVDTYSGGAEHAVMHLLYARFWTKALFDAGLLGFTEPFTTLKNQGSMLAWTPGRRPRETEGEGKASGRVLDWILLKPEEIAGFPAGEVVWRWARMSKSRGNVITPEDVIQKYGADSLRLYVCFVAPFEDDVEWKDTGVAGVFRFLHRLWRWTSDAINCLSTAAVAKSPSAGGPAEMAVRRAVHSTTADVTDLIERFRFNRSVAALMTLVNTLYEYAPPKELPARCAANPALLREAVQTLVLLAAPFAPHLADELWNRMGNTTTTYDATWPVADPSAMLEELRAVPVQVNGKLKDVVTVPANAPNEEIQAAALLSVKVQQALTGLTVVKALVVQDGKLVNLVAK